MHRSRTLTYRVFQCSSASRKFLNRAYAISASGTHIGCFSALQRAENSSIGLVRERVRNRVNVSVLFSEPKIPQCRTDTTTAHSVSVSVLFSEPKIPQSRRSERNRVNVEVSVLFSEPKIPQWLTAAVGGDDGACFSALQRAENSSIRSRPRTCT